MGLLAYPLIAGYIKAWRAGGGIMGPVHRSRPQNCRGIQVMNDMRWNEVMVMAHRVYSAYLLWARIL